MVDDNIRKRRENTRRQIESNDPDLTKLNIGTGNHGIISVISPTMETGREMEEVLDEMST